MPLKKAVAGRNGQVIPNLTIPYERLNFHK